MTLKPLPDDYLAQMARRQAVKAMPKWVSWPKPWPKSVKSAH